jgi:hypothetical protein
VTAARSAASGIRLFVARVRAAVARPWRLHRAARADGFRALALAATLPGEPLYRAFGFEPSERIDTLLPDGVTVPFILMSRPIEP